MQSDCFFLNSVALGSYLIWQCIPIFNCTIEEWAIVNAFMVRMTWPGANFTNWCCLDRGLILFSLNLLTKKNICAHPSVCVLLRSIIGFGYTLYFKFTIVGLFLCWCNVFFYFIFVHSTIICTGNHTKLYNKASLAKW